jgi:hypothetical protein
MNIVEIKGKATTTSANALCATKQYITAKIMIADYQRKGIFMKKLFVSVPMKGRTEEEIKASIQKMKKIAEIYEGEELELIDSYIEDNPPKDSKEAVWYLGESLKKLAQADVFMGICEGYDWNSCCIEMETANKYGIKAYVIPARYVIDDYNALINKLHPVCNEGMPTF